MILFFSLLSLMALTGALALAVALAAPRFRAEAVRELGSYALPFAAAVAAAASLGSLYLSEVGGFVPCLLCWVQRGFMYPLAVLLTAVSIRPMKKWPAPVSLLLSAAGALTALYHYGEQRGWVGGSDQFCGAAAPCTFIWVEQFVFMTIPFMAFTGFLAVALLSGLKMLADRRRHPRP